MNKKLIQKFKKEFDHWLNEGELLYREKDWIDPTAWAPITKQGFDWPEHRNESLFKTLDIIINDEYSEFRKALAEGKIVQFLECVDQNETDSTNDVYDWINWSQAKSHSKFTNGIKYRIKPDEPKFKVGDWVRFIDTPDQIEQYNGKPYHSECNIELWKPQPGKMCIFWDNGSDYFIIAQYKHTNADNRHVSNRNSYDYSNIAPITFDLSIYKDSNGSN